MTTYQCVAPDGTLVCFRKSPTGKSIDFFTSGALNEPWSSDLDNRQWKHQRERVLANDPNGAHPEEVHAAVFLLQYHEVRGIRVEDVVATERPWGHHHPRMWRGVYSPKAALLHSDAVDGLDAHGDVYTRSLVAAASLFEELTNVFRYVEPAADNLLAYGHRFRELMILACTEVEACLRGVLEANTPESRHKDRYSTSDYVALRDPLKLGDWEVSLRDYPSMQALRPFSTWDPARPTASLAWYDAYNAVKHDREGEFARATIGAALESMAALFVLQCAQWGPATFSPLFGDRSSPFLVASAPTWAAGEFYAPEPAHAEQWVADLFFP